jgi:hypothetical protein
MICVLLDLCTSNYMTTKTASWCVSWFYSVPVTEVKCHQILMINVCARGHLYHRSFLSLHSTLPVTSVKCRHVDKHSLLWLVLCLPSVLHCVFCTNYVSRLSSRTSQNSHLETFVDGPFIRISSVSNYSSPPWRNSPPLGQGHLIIEDSWSHSDTPHSAERL